MTERFERWLEDGLRELDAAVPFGADLLPPSRSRLTRVTSPATRSILPVGSFAIGVAFLVIVGFLALRPGAANPGAASPLALGPSPSSSASANGIPTIVSGQPVLSGPAIAAHVVGATDASAFLVGGYLTFVQTDCFIPSGLPTSPLTAPCDDGWLLADGPNAVAGGYRLAVASGVAGWPAGSEDPVVLRVHVHDQRATACAESIKEKCEEAIVVEAVVWSGSSSNPSPAPSGIGALRRPLHLPSLAPGAACPVSPSTTQSGLTPLAGAGPIYPVTTMVGGTVFYEPAAPPNGPGALVQWVAAAGFRGPVLVRGASLADGHPLAFGASEQPELVLPPTNIPTPVGPPGWAVMETDLTVITAPGCYAYQLDGPTFSTVVVFAAQPASGLAGALGRPLDLPVLPAGASCPATAPRMIVSWAAPAIGPGPVFSVGYDHTGNIRWAGSSQDGGWYYIKILWLAAPGTGPILIRGRQLDGSNQVGFGADPVPSPELLLTASAAVGVADAAPGWLNYVAYTRIRAPGCYAYQIDTDAAVETIPFDAGP